MSYRSEIGILITLPENETSDSILNDIKKGWDKEEFDYCFEVEAKENYLILRSKCDLKWYSGFPGVDYTMDFIHDWKLNYNGGGIHFLRIGEDYDDIEEIVIGDPMEFLGMVRYITCDL